MNQAQKNLTTLLALTVVAGGLGLYAYFGVMKPEEQEAERKEVSDKLFPVHAAGERAPDGGAPPAPVINWLSLSAKGDSTTLSRDKDGTWRLTAPATGRADRPTVDAIVQQLQSGKVKAVVEENPTEEDLKRYGLQPPAFTLSATAYVPDEQGGGEGDSSRKRSVMLQGGIENTFDGTVYLRREGDPKVYAAEGAVRSAFDKSTFDLRDKEVLRVDEPSVQRVEVSARKHRYVLERDAQRSWRLVEPVAQRADGARVAQLLSSLQSQRATAFVPDSPDVRAKLGLDKPLVDIRLTYSSGEPARLRLSQVDQNGTKRVLALREQGSDSTFAEVPEAALEVPEVPTAELKDKHLLSFQQAQVQQIVINPGGGAPAITLARAPTASPDAGTSQETWEVVAPQKGMAQQAKVATLLNSLENLQAAALGESNPKRWDTYGLTDSSRSVTLLGSGGEVLARLQVGSEVKGNSMRLWARGALSEVAEVESYTLADLPKTAADVLEAAPAAADGGTAAAAP